VKLNQSLSSLDRLQCEMCTDYWGTVGTTGDNLTMLSIVSFFPIVLLFSIRVLRREWAGILMCGPFLVFNDILQQNDVVWVVWWLVGLRISFFLHQAEKKKKKSRVPSAWRWVTFIAVLAIIHSQLQLIYVELCSNRRAGKDFDHSAGHNIENDTVIRFLFYMHLALRRAD
jgi:hypothetical protein